MLKPTWTEEFEPGPLDHAEVVEYDGHPYYLVVAKCKCRRWVVAAPIYGRCGHCGEPVERESV